MRILLLFLFCSMSFAHATDGFAQKTSINITMQNQTVENILKEIEKQSGYNFYYNNKYINLKRLVSISGTNRPISKLLDELFDGTDITYTVTGKEIVLTTQNVPVSQQQTIKVSGNVSDANGEPIIGASVMEKGTKNAVITNLEGNFTLSVSSNQAEIVISYVGYQEQIVKPQSGRTMNIVLNESLQALDEVVVIGYGSQKKVNVIGSIAAVEGKQLEARSAPNVSNMLTGQLSGVTITQTSGSPGQDGGTIRVRGVGSFGATPSPLVLVDGLPGALNDLNPGDIESISVLKDASSAAIYGSRAANGVILVKTKEGQKGKVNVTYNGYAGFNKANELPEMCRSWEYAELYNMAMGKDVYSPEEIKKYRDGSDPDNYANEMYLQSLLGNKRFQTGHELTVNGGNDKTKYMVSFGYLGQDGLLEHNHFDRYNGRVNLSTEIAKNLTFSAHLNGTITRRNEPSTPGAMDAAGYGGIVLNAVRFPGMWATKLSDGSYGLGAKLMGTPLSWLDSNSFYHENYDKFRTNVELSYQPIKGLTLKAIGGYNYTGQEIRHYRSAMEVTGGKTLGPSSLDDTMYKTEYKTFQAVADYNITLGKHYLSALAGYTWEDESQRTVGGNRLNFPSDDVPYLGAGGADGQTNSGSGYDWAIMSVFGRLTYNYDQRYLFETTMRYDGSSRFPTDSKFGFFPSVAAGWRISEEKFFKETESLQFFDNLKLKASYGILGNNNIGNYPYQSTYALGQAMNYVFGGVYTQGAAVTTYVDPTLKWEKTRTTDIGFESSLWKGKLTFNAAYFYRKTTDILYTPSSSYSSIFGLAISQVNTGSLENKGWEFEIGHRNKVGDFNYNINGNFSIINNKVITLGMGNVEQKSGMVGNGSSLFIGYPMNMYYGYQTDGVFLTDDEVKQWPDQTKIAPNAKAGDLRYVDRNGDKKVDEADKTYLGSTIPKYTFGLNLGADYKGFDFSILLQGVADVKGKLDSYAGYAFSQEGNIQKWQAEECWNNNQTNRYPKYPRLEVMSNAGSNNTLSSDFWILDASYLKVRNIQFGYTLPKKVVQKFGASNLRIYFSTDNPLSFSGYRKGWDPEISTSGSYYPILATYTFGLTLKF